MLRVWNLADGQFGGTDVGGLQLALLQVSGDNLATADAISGRGVLYLPKAATPRQRAALRQWIKSSGFVSSNSSLHERVVPIELKKSGDGYQFSAEGYLSVTTAPLSSCPTGSCGEALWYTPRTGGGVFTVAVNRSSRVSEPLLKLNWDDSGKKSVFLSRFGDETPARNLYVSSVDLCGSGSSLF